SQSEGRRFDPACLHQNSEDPEASHVLASFAPQENTCSGEVYSRHTTPAYVLAASQVLLG
ncbi:hypothetical protein, partial [Accumulibacter sp.]|uniref:hypothetical protein n=1 Tax=Accumulibacter sp. TaxID=2053492 RepID=UPI0028C40038